MHVPPVQPHRPGTLERPLLLLRNPAGDPQVRAARPVFTAAAPAVKAAQPTVLSPEGIGQPPSCCASPAPRSSHHGAPTWRTRLSKGCAFPRAPLSSCPNPTGSEPMATRPEQLYQGDFYAWTRHQARALRRLTTLRLSTGLDLDHLAEEALDEVLRSAQLGLVATTP